MTTTASKHESVEEAAKRTGAAGPTPGETGAADEGKKGAEAQGEAAKKSSKRGGARPGAGRKKSTPPESIMPAAQWQLVIGGLLDMVCEAWQIAPRAPEQKKALADTSLAVLNKHLSIGDHAEEVALAITAVAIGTPMILEKVQVDRYLAEQPPAEGAPARPDSEDAPDLSVAKPPN